MRRLLPPHLEGRGPVPADTSNVAEEHCLLTEGAVLLLDAEGSTELAARLRARGTLGAEPLDVLLDKIFARVVDTVFAFGGYIGHFTGDGVIAVFPGEPAVTVANAIEAARVILEHLHRLSGIVTAAGPVELAVRAVVGAGSIDTFVWRARSITSMDQQNATYVIVGDALTEAHAGELRVVGGALGLGPAAVAAVPGGPYVPLSDVDNGLDGTGGGGVGLAHRYVKVDLERLTRRPADPTFATSASTCTGSSRTDNDWRFVIPEAFDETIAPEFRDASVLFLELREWPHEDTVAVILEQAAASGGHISNILRTSSRQRGITFMLLWGAPTGHVDDATRSLGFVEAVQHEIGIDEFKTGAVYSHMFIGFVGSDAQSTYTAIGAPVNLAARLCDLASWGEIRVTEAFDEVVPSHWAVESVVATLYKGFGTPLVTRSLRPSGSYAPHRRTEPGRQAETPSPTVALPEHTSSTGPPE